MESVLCMTSFDLIIKGKLGNIVEKKKMNKKRNEMNVASDKCMFWEV